VLGFHIATPLPHAVISTQGPESDKWYPLPARTVTFNKTSATSKLRITLQDTLGTYASVYNGCKWRFLVDGVEIGFFSAGDTEPLAGWRMDNGAHVAWAFGVGTGTRVVKVEWMRLPVGVECLAGWNNTANFLSVEEIP
jgi:hypothetical protein